MPRTAKTLRRRKERAVRRERATRHERAVGIANERLLARIQAIEERRKNVPFAEEQSTEPHFVQGGLPGLGKRH